MMSSMELPETASERDPLTLESIARAERYEDWDGQNEFDPGDTD